MAVLDVLNLNLGTEQNPNWVLHDLHDKRISTNAVTTATHILATNAGVTAMNPITADNLASVLGETIRSQGSITNLDSVTDSGVYNITSSVSNSPTSDGLGLLIVRKYSNGYRVIQIFTDDELGPAVYYRKTKNGGGVWTPWKQFYDTSLLTNSTMLAQLASALGVLPKVGYSESAWNNYTDYFMMPYIGGDGPVLFIHFPFTWNNKPACVELSIDRIRIAIRTYWNNEWGARKSVVLQ